MGTNFVLLCQSKIMTERFMKNYLRKSIRIGYLCTLKDLKMFIVVLDYFSIFEPQAKWFAHMKKNFFTGCSKVPLNLLCILFTSFKIPRCWFLCFTTFA